MLYPDLSRKEVKKRRHIYVRKPVAESLGCRAETHATLESNSAPGKISLETNKQIKGGWPKPLSWLWRFQIHAVRKTSRVRFHPRPPGLPWERKRLGSGSLVEVHGCLQTRIVFTGWRQHVLYLQGINPSQSTPLHNGCGSSGNRWKETWGRRRKHKTELSINLPQSI